MSQGKTGRKTGNRGNVPSEKSFQIPGPTLMFVMREKPGALKRPSSRNEREKWGTQFVSAGGGNGATRQKSICWSILSCVA
jgi:hypothetical protein